MKKNPDRIEGINRNINNNRKFHNNGWKSRLEINKEIEDLNNTNTNRCFFNVLANNSSIHILLRPHETF